MVQQEGSNSGDEANSTNTSVVIPINRAKGIETGKYQLVGWGIDTTGRRLIDEIIHVAAYTSPESEFSQYIMPFADINPIYSRRHGIRIINMIRYRRLRDVNTNVFVKTKSEISALQDFLQWLESVKTTEIDGLILVYYEMHKASPGMLLESLRRHNLIDRFSKVVKGFANGFDIAQAKCQNTTKSFNLRIISQVLLNREDESFSNALHRAKASLDITTHLAQSEVVEVEGKPEGGCTGTEPHIINFVCPFTNPIEAEEEEIAVFKVLLERQNTFRPVFGALLRASKAEREHAAHLRRLLAENNINYDKLKAAYEDGAKEGLEKVIKSEVANANEKDLEELLEILDCFFDPAKKAVQPKLSNQRYYQQKVRRPNQRPYNNRYKNSRSATRSPKKEQKKEELESDTTTPRSEPEHSEPENSNPETVVVKQETPVVPQEVTATE